MQFLKLQHFRSAAHDASNLLACRPAHDERNKGGQQMTSRIFSFRWRRPEVRLLEELSDRGIDTEKLTLLVLLGALEAAGLVLFLKEDKPLARPFQDPWWREAIFPGADYEDEDDS